MKYEGQERVKILTGKFKDCEGYVRIVSPHGFLTVAVNGSSPKITLKEDEVQFIHKNYFLSHTEEALKKLKTN